MGLEVLSSVMGLLCYGSIHLWGGSAMGNLRYGAALLWGGSAMGWLHYRAAPLRGSSAMGWLCYGVALLWGGCSGSGHFPISLRRPQSKKGNSTGADFGVKKGNFGFSRRGSTGGGKKGPFGVKKGRFGVSRGWDLGHGWGCGIKRVIWGKKGQFGG